MLKIVMIMLCGIGTGYLLRNKKMSFIGRIITALIWVLPVSYTHLTLPTTERV